jgi:hypothetical protein
LNPWWSTPKEKDVRVLVYDAYRKNSGLIKKGENRRSTLNNALPGISRQGNEIRILLLVNDFLNGSPEGSQGFLRAYTAEHY